MNRFLAMLKDSFREAVDGWIFLVMLVISAVVILLVASISTHPLPAEEAIPKMLQGQGMRMVNGDRGNAKKLAIFLYQVQAENGVATSPQSPWEGEIRFTLTYSSTGFGPTGMEVDDPKNPKKVNQIDKQGGMLFSDAFKDAVQYWATPSEAKTRPKYTDELAIEFVTAQVRDVARLNVTRIEPVSGGPPTSHKFAVTADGGNRLGWAYRPGLFLGLWQMSFLDMPLGDLIHLIEDTLVHGLGTWVILLAGVIVTAGFIPNMLRKGAIDLLLTKPMSRPLILLYKYLGGLMFVFLLTAFTVGGVWLVLGLRTGVWSPGLLYSTFGITMYFAVLYACSTLFGVLSRNAIVSIVVTMVFWFVVWLIGFLNQTFITLSNMEFRNQPAVVRPTEEGKPSEEAVQPQPSDRIPETLVSVFRVLNRMTPRTKDLDDLTSQLIGQGLLSDAEIRQKGVGHLDLNWPEVLGLAGGYIVLFLGLATFRFVTRSY